jgi:tight adherence protein B
MTTFILLLSSVAGGLLVWSLSFTLKGIYANFEKKYAAAGQAHLDSLYMVMSTQQLMILSITSGAIVSFFSFIFNGGDIAFSLISGIIGLFAPLFLLSYLKRKRQKLFNEQLIDALGNMGNSLKAGFTLPQAIELIGREMDDPIGMEFRIAHSEMRLGLPPVEALQNIANRVQIQDLDLVVTSVGISQDIGGNLTRVFDSIAHTIRERFRVEGRIRSLSAMGRMQGLVLITMPFLLVLFMSKFQKGFIEPLFHTTLGQIFCVAGLIWLFIGWISIKKIVDIDV